VRFSDLDGQRIALWGVGRETTALAEQIDVRLPDATLALVVDENENHSHSHLGREWRGVVVLAPSEAAAALDEVDVLVRSPGVSIYKPLIQEAIGKGKTVTTATGLWMAERGGRHVIGVTGTKGKSTTATVIAHLLGQITPTELAGNIGRPVIELLDLHPETWVVCELSSYQLADLTTGPEVAVLTNLYREHTDWHGSEEQYRADKLRIFELPGTRIAVRPPADGWPTTFDPGPLRGRHNAQNVAAAVAAIEAAGFEPPALPQGLGGLEALPHRLQIVHTDADGTEWVDDSISTTPESTIAALEAFGERPVVLIAGGSERQQDYQGLGRALAGRAAETYLILLPETGARLAAAAASQGFAEDRMSTAGDMREAVRLVPATPGGVVLLSPAAPSFTQYANFEERGEDFAALALRA
jgi:UDP-N-acetylmuramoyl-L-alanine---L-glutamate ligase